MHFIRKGHSERSLAIDLQSRVAVAGHVVRLRVRLLRRVAGLHCHVDLLLRCVLLLCVCAC